MTDRAQSALKATGMDEASIASLEKEDALFALTAQTLLFQDGGGTRRVTLRDLTRIHSDQEGTLRVETPAGTALTASLLGFDAARVQAFFAQVRDTTARAKQQAAAPLSSGEEKPVASVSAAPSVIAASTPAPVSPPPATPVAPTISAPVAPEPQKPEVQKPEARKAPPTIVIGDPDDGEEDAEAVAPVTRTVISPAPSTPAPSLTKPAAAPAPAPSTPQPPTPQPPSTPQPPTPQPVVISSSGFSPSSARPTVPYGSGTSSSVTPAPAAQPAPTPAPKMAAPSASVVAAPTPSAPTLQPTAIRTLPTRSASVSGLYAQADAVEALVSRLRILGVVLGVSAIALAFFLFRADQQLSGIWTLIAGGVGGISLLTLAELARLLVGIARATGNGGNSADE
ncbi:hypothetical protein E7T06_17425 [Deinococcus sp. Arct2-2]|uniref:hypothetical protein n=1 Tax=Deinococcus sp. Arct2-2 TaxID=2568653 RepID=UPI0010A2B62F|nr:hypothetical protein [Deinococcus sp. Arct2-2]THF68195.1 hypothetical protein E7T06_17425 [Deinococcus sp. Arct2-2]